MSGASACLFIGVFIYALIDLAKGTSNSTPGDILELLVIAFPSIFAILLCVKGPKMNKNAAFGMSVGGVILWAVTLFALVFVAGLIDAFTHACIATSSSGASSAVSSSSSASGSCGTLSSNFDHFFLSAILFVIFLLIHEVLLGLGTFLKNKNLLIPLFIGAGLVTLASVAFAILSGIYLGGASTPFFFAIFGTDALVFALTLLLIYGTNEKAPRDQAQGV